MNKMILKYFLLSIFSIFFIIYLLYIEKESKIEHHLKDTSISIDKNYKLIYSYYKNIANLIFDNHINKQEILKLVSRANDFTLEKEILRDNLYKDLKKTYKVLNNNNLKQLHFHLKNNESFLRFHRIKEYGDNIEEDRDTVKYVNKTKKQIDGFEEGKIYNGIRFVFPLFYKNKHIGSVETSFSTLAMTSEFVDKLKLISNYLIKKSIVDKKVFKNELTNYKNSYLKDYYVEKTTLEFINSKISFDKQMCCNQTVIKEFNKRIDKEELFSIYSENCKKIITFKKIYNPVTNKFNAIFVVITDDNYAENKNKNFYFISFIISFFISLFFCFLYKYNIYRENIKNNLSLTESILNSTDNAILVISNDRKILKYNSNFIDLWGLPISIVKKGYDKEVLDFVMDKIAQPDDFIKKVNYLYDNPKKESFEYISFKDGRIIERVSKPMYIDNIVVARVWGFRDKTNEIKTKKELEKLNKTLQKRVEKEVSLSRTRDKKVVEQSRLAQMGEMISMIAHQWRQPLGAISGAVISIQSKISLGKFDLSIELDREKFKIFLEKKINQIEAYIKFLSTTIDEFRDFYKKDKEKVYISTSQVIEDVLKIVETSMKNKNLILDLDIQDKNPTLLYKNELMQVILNILKNSEDNFLEKNQEIKEIKISTNFKDNKHIITISDNGGGIDKEILPNIFKPYFSTKEEKNGTGLGLYMSKTIIQEHHNGSLTVNNNNNGVVFTIII